jgi:cytosine/adenosine deaminase-related metal-dependent hydrolase
VRELDEEWRQRVSGRRGRAGVAADRAAVSDLRRSDRSRGLGERRHEVCERRGHRFGVREPGAEPKRPVLPRPARQLGSMGEIEDDRRPQAVEVELDHQVGTTGDGDGVRPIGLDPKRLFEAARGQNVHARQGTVRLVATVLTNAHVVTMDDAGTELPGGWVHVDDGTIGAVGSGSPPGADDVVDVRGAVVTPGLVNTHHHLYQALTRTRAQQADLFTWLKTLYPIWSRIDDEAEYAAARTGLAELALSGCSTVFDHHYVFPRGRSGLVEAELQAARELGVRLVASRGSMDLGVSDGGLPPDELVEDADDVLAESERLAALHEPGPGARVQIALAPCSPFSVTRDLMVESAALARRLGLRLHTHLAETVEEDSYCRELYGCSPVEYLAELGWVDEDVWCAHCVHLSEGDVRRFASAGTGVAHCPTSNLRLGAGVAPVRSLIDAGVPVGLGVDGSASNERGDLAFEVKQALLVARGRGGPEAMTAREALRLATRGGAAVLGREDIGAIEPGRCADLAVWPSDRLELAGADDPVAALVLAGPECVDRLFVGGEEVVSGGRLVRGDELEIAREHRKHARRIAPPE